ncbi:HD domain-containing protein [Epibacterium sp. SM1979]|uniref:HD domain-containing protein n=1 Tax=Tritonibacter litoralis TaxID=2662264 RepID=A0A843YIJ7_9RHOB|nr:HD domain-containing protein [Tritonibacter litoralis]MQQ09092.1 HD domain-containing protein [Tritonibacter litoralis]
MSDFKSTQSTVHDAAIWTGTCYMDLLDPNPAEIHLTDIARALSRLARFNGFGRAFYSVAEHSVWCVRVFEVHAAGDIYSDPVLRDIARDILLHDAPEAYLGDVTSPLKAHLPDYQRLETRMAAAIAARFNLTGSAPEWVKRCDREMLAIEKADLLPTAGPWPVDGLEYPPNISPLHLTPSQAENFFLQEAQKLGFDTRAGG